MDRKGVICLLVLSILGASIARSQEYTYDWEHPAEPGTVSVRLEHLSEYGHTYGQLVRAFNGPDYRVETLVFDAESLLPIRAEMQYEVQGLPAKKMAWFQRNALQMEWQMPELMGGEVVRSEVALPENTYALQCLPLLLQKKAESTAKWRLNLINPLAQQSDEDVEEYELKWLRRENGVEFYQIRSLDSGAQWQVGLNDDPAYPLFYADCVFTDLKGTLELR